MVAYVIYDYTRFPVGKQHFLFKQLDLIASNSWLIICWMQGLSKYEQRKGKGFRNAVTGAPNNDS